MDTQTNAPDTDYFFLGDGRIMAILQWSRNPSLSPFGLILYDPERMSRKHGSLLFHPELGLSRTMLTVIANGVRYTPRHDDLHMTWNFGNKPVVLLRWNAGDIEVTEKFSMQSGRSNLLRDITLSMPEPHSVEIEAALYANPLYFDEFGARPGGRLYAAGYASLALDSVPIGRAFERFLTVTTAGKESAIAATLVYSIEAVGTHEFSLYPSDHSFPSLSAPEAPAVDLGESFSDAVEQSAREHHPPSLAARIAEHYRISQTSLRAAVSQLGKFDASIWQYDFEWGLDAAMVATAAASSGMFDLARQVLANILRRLSNDEGMIAEASRFRGGEMAELNGNGAVLDAVWHYWKWTGDETLLHAYWKRFAAIADYPLRQEFQHPSGLLKTRRDFWERTPWMGVREGFELGHQVYCAVGLRRAAEIAAAFGKPEEARRWQGAGERILDAMLHHPQFSLVDDGRFIRRRLVDGSVQRELLADPDYHDPDYASYIPATGSTYDSPREWEPDIVEALPIVYGLVEGKSDLARTTLDTLEALWNPTGIGGYARYNINSDPDSPGPWAFATAFMAAAEIEGGQDERAGRSINWLLDVAGGGGSWFEYYGERRTPPFPPVGVIVWGWAQYLLLVVKHIVGVRVVGSELRITPKLVGIEHTVRFGGYTISISVRGLHNASLDGEPMVIDGGAARISLPLTSHHRLDFLS